MNGIDNLFVVALLACWTLFAITVSVWTYRDARARGLRPLLMALLIGLTFPLGLPLWILLRPRAGTKFDLQLEESRIEEFSSVLRQIDLLLSQGESPAALELARELLVRVKDAVSRLPLRNDLRDLLKRLETILPLFERLHNSVSTISALMRAGDETLARVRAEELLPQVEEALYQFPEYAALLKLRQWLRDFLSQGIIPFASDDFQTPLPQQGLIDNVHFTLTGPLVLSPGSTNELRFWVHVEQQRSTVLRIARKIHGVSPSEMAVESEGPCPLPRGSRISIRLSIDGITCLDSHKWIYWTGEIGSAAFLVTVPLIPGAATVPGRASIRLNGCEIARMSFLIHVGSPNRAIKEIPSRTACYRTAFASYASDDRIEVLGRVQGMEAAYKGLDVFVDVIDLRSGDNWEQELVRRISSSDVFYLFWCRHAMNSAWVDKEWRCALSAKGIDFIDPIPLQVPELAPPPEELATKHFNDPFLAFIAAAGGKHPD